MAAVAAFYPKFQQLGIKVLAISTDSVYSHKVFSEVSPSMRNVRYPLVSDRNQQISRAYRVLDESQGAAKRATVVIDPEGIIVSKIVYPKDVGRGLPELIRLLEALQFHRSTGLGAPANWTPGMPGIRRDIANAGSI